ncbi:MAG: gamma-glutamyl-gamma-aminobutyrate hydrolase family protein, partial [Sideroxyarcus sp.]|nr:gamma-glutamyl-gamma-aminobutyrate hydrolase family protein [Sideroxyarcus sp.]
MSEPIEPVTHDSAGNTAPSPNQVQADAAAPQPSTQHNGTTQHPSPDEQPWRAMWQFFSARFQALSGKAARGLTRRTLKIGVSARIFHPEPGAVGLRSKTLQYLEESIAQWIMTRDVMVFMIPTVNANSLLHPSNIRLRDYAKHLDGLVLQGGADVSPQSYSQVATRPEWSGDRSRDMYELELLHEFIEAGKPVLG